MNNITLKYALEIIDSPAFQQLQKIGGGRQYHQEGSAFVHSLLVFNNSFEFWQDSPMNIIALLHDIGKIYTGRQKENGDWEYLNHAKIGASHLLEFLPKELRVNTWFCEEANYFITNHIKPLFWDQKGYPKKDVLTIDLAKLAICDLKGSFSELPQDDKIQSLCDYIAEG
jgi:hypothetical protein